MGQTFKFDGEDIDIDTLPKPAGWRVLVGKAQMNDKTSGGIVIPDEVKKYMQNSVAIVKVLAMGPLCFDKETFRGSNPKKPIEPWYKVGDVLVIGKLTGQEYKCMDNNNVVKTLKFLNDDECIAVISNMESVVI
jgi:co-chaperonin GroES (HSP10)